MYKWYDRTEELKGDIILKRILGLSEKTISDVAEEDFRAFMRKQN